MHAMSLNIAQQLVTDRRTSYEGIAVRRRLRSLVRRGALESASETRVGPRPALRITGPRTPAAPATAARKVA